MASVEPKSGKLYKFGHGLFGPKWTEKWVHLDGHVLKYFSMASEQAPLFSLSSAKQSYSIELASYDFALLVDKRITRKHTFHLVPKSKASKVVVFACANERELQEWQDAFQTRFASPADGDVAPVVAEKMRRANDAFSAGDISDYSILQQQLDPNVEGRISREQFVRVMKHYFVTRADAAFPSTESTTHQKVPEATPRSSFSDHPRRPPSKPSEVSEPEVVSEADPSEDHHHLLNNASPATLNAVVREDGEAIDPERDEASRDWQAEFDTLLSKAEPTDEILGGLQMASFIAEFRCVAENIVEQLVNEIAIDEDARKIRSAPLDDDQLLGTDYSERFDGLREQITKFVAGGLLVYVTHDETTHRVFGDQVRASRALHEAIADTKAEMLQIPLQCIVDYLGFRALVIAQPMDRSRRLLSSRMLTSCDRKTQLMIHDQMKAVWRHLGIFVDDVQSTHDNLLDRIPNFVGQAAGVYVGAHLGRPVCRLYNVFDVFPAEDRRAFRHEFVAQCGDTLPLHPAAFVEFANATSMTMKQAVVFQQIAASAMDHLRSIVVPVFVDSAETLCAQIYDSSTLTAALHREGINVRYLGLCFEMATTKHTKRLFLSEMIARACKNELRAAYQLVFQDAAVEAKRASSQEAEATVVEEPLSASAVSRKMIDDRTAQVALEFFNLVFGIGSADSRTFWHDRIIPRIVQRFVFTSECSLDGLKASMYHEEWIHWPQLFLAVQYHTNTVLPDETDICFGSLIPFPSSLLLRVLPCSIMLCQSSRGCETQLSESDSLVRSGQIAEALDCVKVQIAMADAAPRHDKAPCIAQLLIVAAELSLQLDFVRDAEKFATLALEASPARSAAYARGLLISLKSKNAQSRPMEELQRTYSIAIETATWHLGSSHPILFDFFMTMMEIQRQRGDQDGSLKSFDEAATLIKTCYGRSSLAYADIRRKQGEALLVSSLLDEAASVFDEAFSVYERLLVDVDCDEPSRLEARTNGAVCLEMIADAQAAQPSANLLEVAFATAVRAYVMRAETLRAGHPDTLRSLLQLGELCVALGDSYRALEYYRPALALLKAHPAKQVVDELKKVSQTVLGLHLRSLAADKQAILDKTKNRFTECTKALEDCVDDTSLADSNDRETELGLLRFVTRQILAQDPIDYVNRLLDKADQELQAMRRERFASGALRRESAAEDPVPPLRSPLSAGASSRFASFAIGQSLTPLTTILTSASPRSSSSSSVGLLDCPASLRTASGEFTFGGQLAAVVFLASLAADGENAA